MIYIIGVRTNRFITIENGNSALGLGDIDSNSNHSKSPRKNRFDLMQHFKVQTYFIVKLENAKAEQLA